MCQLCNVWFHEGNKQGDVMERSCRGGRVTSDGKGREGLLEEVMGFLRLEN